MMMTRQDLRPFDAALAAKIDVTRGAYILSEDEGFEAVILASGSEVNLALDAAAILRGEGRKVRIVSVPSLETFLRQDAAFRESILPNACRKRISIEAGTTPMWYALVGLDGLAIGLDHFGASAPYKKLAQEFGFTPEAVADKVRAYLQA